MDVGSPVTDLIPGARGAVLVTLAQLAVPVTVRTLARHAGVSPQGALTLVNELKRAGIVDVRPAGRSLMVGLNREHLAVAPLLALVSTRGRLVDRLTVELAEWAALAGAWLFGSAARGDGGTDSDIDLVLVASRSTDTARWASQTAGLVTKVQAWTGNTVQLVEHTRRSFASLVQADNPLIAALRVEGIPLTGKARQLIRRAG